MSRALVTGASSGIGRELARAHARRGGDLVLAARGLDALEALAAELEDAHGIEAHPLKVDLSGPEAPARVHDWCAEQGLRVDVLVNNAGFGGHGRFHARDPDADAKMVQVNVQALTALTHAFLPAMVDRGHGRILNVGSTAGFLPGPLQAVYYATKAYVNSFSQALSEELRGTGVTVTVLCPGPVETGFAEAADMGGVGIFDDAVGPESVAEAGYRAMEQGKDMVVVPRRYAFLMRAVLPWVPRRTRLRLSRRAMER